MDLRQRLNALRQQSGAAEPAPAACERVPDLAERIARLAASSRARQAARPDDASVAALLGGEVIAQGLIAVERRHALHELHGNAPLAALLSAPLALLAGEAAAESLLFLDTETTGLAGGTGTLAFLVGLARIEGDALRVRQLFLTGFGGEAALLGGVQAWVQSATHLVSFNGKSFDLPLLTARYRLARLRHPFDGRGHLDLLHPTRAVFAGNWEDCRLATAERRLLGFARRDDLPGHLVPEAWSSFVRAGDSSRLAAILEHNRWDLLSLAALLERVASAYGGSAEAADPLAVARFHRRRGAGEEARASLALRAETLDEAGLLELARLHRSSGRLDEAVTIWEALAMRDCIAAIENLAKHHEHHRRDYHGALSLTLRLRRLQPGQVRHERREVRLLARTARHPTSLD